MGNSTGTGKAAAAATVAGFQSSGGAWILAAAAAFAGLAAAAATSMSARFSSRPSPLFGSGAAVAVLARLLVAIFLRAGR